MKDDISHNLKNILQTTHLEFTKSAFLIDLIKHENTSLYVEIVQSINEDDNETQSIKINSSVLPELIKVLQAYQKVINRKAKNSVKNITTIKSNHFTEEQKDEIQRRYLKGISLDDLVVQFRQKKEVIEMILRNRNIEIVSNKLPKKQWRKYWRRRRR